MNIETPTKPTEPMVTIPLHEHLTLMQQVDDLREQVMALQIEIAMRQTILDQLSTIKKLTN